MPELPPPQLPRTSGKVRRGSGHNQVGPIGGQHSGANMRGPAPGNVDGFHQVAGGELNDIKPQLNVGPLQCRYCDRRFKYPSQLKDHMHTHNGHRPYMCTECGMDFMKVGSKSQTRLIMFVINGYICSEGQFIIFRIIFN